jgi:hypothetical protein
MAIEGTLLRIVCLGFGALFAVGAAVQWNDPDPLPWMLAYGLAAVLSTAAARGRVWPRVTVLFALGMALWFLWLAPSLLGAPEQAFTSFQMRATSHEEPREAVGLALLAAWNAFLAHRAHRSRRDARQRGGSAPGGTAA